MLFIPSPRTEKQREKSSGLALPFMMPPGGGREWFIGAHLCASNLAREKLAFRRIVSTWGVGKPPVATCRSLTNLQTFPSLPGSASQIAPESAKGRRGASRLEPLLGRQTALGSRSGLSWDLLVASYSCCPVCDLGFPTYDMGRDATYLTGV